MCGTQLADTIVVVPSAQCANTTFLRLMRQSEEIAQDILDYLKQRPQASDTLEGVAGWWIMSQQLGEAVGLVQQALKQLSATGEIEVHKNLDGRTVYTARDDSR